MKRRNFFKMFAKAAVIALSAPEFIRSVIARDLSKAQAEIMPYWVETRCVRIDCTPEYLAVWNRLVETNPAIAQFGDA